MVPHAEWGEFSVLKLFFTESWIKLWIVGNSSKSSWSTLPRRTLEQLYMLSRGGTGLQLLLLNTVSKESFFFQFFSFSNFLSTVNGDREWHSCRNLGEEEITQWINLMKTQNGSSSSLRLRKMWHTDVPSIQGPWTPFTLKNPANNLVVFPDEESSKPLDVEKSATEKLIELFREQRLFDGKLEENRAN